MLLALENVSKRVGLEKHIYTLFIQSYINAGLSVA